MNQQNFDYLKDQVKFTGFGESLENDLKANMQKNLPEFQLSHNQSFGKDKTEAVLFFRQSENGNYFFNKYNLSVNEDTRQTFFISNPAKVKIETSPGQVEEKTLSNNYTLKEAYNLLEGRAVNKDLYKVQRNEQASGQRYEPTGEAYNAWVQLNFKEIDGSGNYKLKQYHQNYGYNVEQVLSNHPIKELLNEEDKSKVIDSLKKGNRQSVTFNTDSGEVKRFIEANPQFKSINIYDGNMNRIRQDVKEADNNTQYARQEVKNSEKNKVDDEVNTQSQKKNKKQGQKVS